MYVHTCSESTDAGFEVVLASSAVDVDVDVNMDVDVDAAAAAKGAIPRRQPARRKVL